MQLESMYQEIILDHYRNPHHKGLRAPFDAEVHHVNPTCGDEITLRVKLDGDKVTDVSYDSAGCSISQASASVLTDLVIGHTVGHGFAAHDEFQDIVSLKLLSGTLTDVGKPLEGLVHAKAALAQAMREQALVNYAAGHLMRQAIKTGSAEVVNEALAALVDSTQVPRTDDCALETDWIDAANALGADKELTDWVRAVASRKTE